MDDVRFVSYNINGLGDTEKRRDIFCYLKNLKCPIVLLQETHCTVEVEHLWRAEWGGNMICSHGTSASKGVLTLIRKNAPIKVIDTLADSEGRWVITDLEIEGTELSLVNVYSPNEDNAEFYLNLFTTLDDRDRSETIIAGDLNLTLDPVKDYGGTGESRIHVRKREVLTNYMQATGMQDVWRNAHPDEYIFTWKRDGPPLQTSRLDYFLVSESLLSRVKSTSIAPRYKSDHNRIELVMNFKNFPRGKGYWKFNNLYLKDKEFVDKMNESIERFLLEQTGEISPQNKWEKLKVEIKMVASEHAVVKANARNRLVELLEFKLDKLDTKLAKAIKEKDTPLKFRTLKDIKRTQEFLEEEHEIKTKAAMFRSKCKFYNEGKKPTKYFFGLEKCRSNLRAVKTLRVNGSVEMDPRVILKEEALFFSKLYKKEREGHFNDQNNSDCKLSENEQAEMETSPSIEELGNALKQMDNNKTPGCDGLSAGFYKVFWSKIKLILYEAIQEGLNNGKLHNSALTGIITLIPKKEKELLFLDNWRPITLLNVDYKILTKALALRVKKKLPHLINEDQTGYMHGRNISHNIRKILDIIHIAEKKKIDMVIVSVDYQKCFDRLAWGAIKAALKFFGFGDSFCGYVQTCLNHSQLAVSNDGRISAFFNPTRGVKQGDCLSPYLALLVLEVLSIRIRENSKIKGISINNKEHKLVQFADDLNLFLEYNRVTLLEIARTFDQFECETDLKINYDKTSIYRIGSLKDTDAQLYTGKPFRWTNSPPIVLGVVVSNDYTETENCYKKILSRAKQIINRWRWRSLSLLGKVTIVNSLISSLFVYPMQVLENMSAARIKEFETLINGFLWGEGKRTKISLQVLSNPREFGGLNLSNIMAKQDSLKIKWVDQCRLFPKIADLAREFLPIEAEIFWRANLSKKDIALFLGDSFWHDVAVAWSKLNHHDPSDKEEIVKEFLWYNSHLHKENKPFIFREALSHGIQVIGDILNTTGDGFSTYFEITQKYGPQALTCMQYNTVITCIPQRWKACLSDNQVNSNYKIWYDKIENKTTKQVYRKFVENFTVTEQLRAKWQMKLGINLDKEKFENIFFNLYKNTLSAKLRSFQFKLIHRRIYLNNTLYKWKIVDSARCQYCQEEYETIEHLFFHCPIVVRFWELFQNWYECQTNTEILLDAQTVLLSNSNNLTLNALTISAKQFIFGRKVQDKFINFYIFKDNVKQQIKFKLSLAKQHNTKAGWVRFKKKWGKMID